jgi:hypothetical protein
MDWVLGPLTQVYDGSFISMAMAIDKAVNKKITGETMKTIPFHEKPPTPIRPPRGHAGIIDCDSIEVARQLTLLEFENFLAIQPKECLNLSWSKEGRETKSPNIVKMINRSNALGHWLAIQILIEPKVKSRAKLIKSFIQIAKVNNSCT